MAVELIDLKNYLRVDADIDDDDTLITSLGAAAVSYMEQTTGKKFDSSKELMDLAVKELVALWYENRITFTTKTNVNELPHSLQAMLIHISLAQYYPGLESES